MVKIKNYESEPDGFTSVNKLNARLLELDERGLVLSLAAFAEDTLGELLRAFFRKNSSASGIIDGFNAPLGTFSSRIRGAHALGLITDDQFKDLEILRRIRNEFSHTWEHISFEKQKIKDSINLLSYSSLEDKFPNTLEEKIRSSISSVLVELSAVINKINSNDLRLGMVGMRLIAGLNGDEEEQLATSQARLSELREQLPLAEGREKQFLMMLRMRWVHRLEIAAKTCADHYRYKFIKIAEELRSEISKDKNI